MTRMLLGVVVVFVVLFAMAVPAGAQQEQQNQEQEVVVSVQQPLLFQVGDAEQVDASVVRIGCDLFSLSEIVMVNRPFLDDLKQVSRERVFFANPVTCKDPASEVRNASIEMILADVGRERAAAVMNDLLPPVVFIPPEEVVTAAAVVSDPLPPAVSISTTTPTQTETVPQTTLEAAAPSQDRVLIPAVAITAPVVAQGWDAKLAAEEQQRQRREIAQLRKQLATANAARVHLELTLKDTNKTLNDERKAWEKQVDDWDAQQKDRAKAQKDDAKAREKVRAAEARSNYIGGVTFGAVVVGGIGVVLALLWSVRIRDNKDKAFTQFQDELSKARGDRAKEKAEAARLEPESSLTATSIMAATAVPQSAPVAVQSAPIDRVFPEYLLKWGEADVKFTVYNTETADGGEEILLYQCSQCTNQTRLKIPASSTPEAARMDCYRHLKRARHLSLVPPAGATA